MITQANRWLTLWVRDFPLAISLESVREVLLWIPWQSIPSDVPARVGVLSLRGGNYPVWEIARLWGWTAHDPDVETCFVLLNDDAGGCFGAVIVDKIGWVVDMPDAGSGAGEESPEGLLEKLAVKRVVYDAETGIRHYAVDVVELCKQAQERRATLFAHETA